MASSLFVNTVHVCFESVLAMDNAGMVAMFESLVDTGLKGFLGCSAVIHEAALLEFFENGSVMDGLVVSTVNGVTVEISKQLFAETFELPVVGLTDLSEIPNLVFDARSIVSLSGEPVSMSGKKKEMMIEFRLLCDILAKTISVKAGSFDAITQEKLLMMAVITCGVRINWNRLLFNILKDMVTPGSRQAKGYAIQISLLLENVPNLELGESSEFPSSKVLTGKTVHRYIVLNDKVCMEDVTAEPRVKKTPTKKVASKKRPAQTLLLNHFTNRATPSAKMKNSEEEEEVEMKEQTMAHGLKWEKTCCSKIFEGRPRDRGAIIARTNTNTRSTCWIRTMIRVDGVWVEPCADHWMSIWKSPNLFSGKLLPVGSINFFRTLAVVEPVSVFVPRQSSVICWRLSQLCTAFVRYSLFAGLSTEDISSFVSTIALDRTVLRNVQIVQSSISVAPSGQMMMLDQSSFSSSTSDDSSMHFDDHDTADTSISLPPAATDVIESLAKLRASIDQVRSEQFRRKEDAHNLKDILLVHLRDLEKRISARFDEQDRVHSALRKDTHDQKNLLSLDLKSTHQNLSAQIAVAAFDTVDVQKVVKEINAKVNYLDGKVAEIRSEQLDFRAKTEENYLNLSTQLGLIVDYLRSGDAKKGESCSSRPQPPPDNQSRPSGGNDGSGNRPDQQRSGARDSGNRGEGQRRGDRSGSSKRRYSSSGGGPFRRSFEDWIG
ncbi:hypothetical protein F511_38077 [Dorcoceras hygrometricum]|uniref:Dystroglycan-like n=1 Tax=Dorcoceras hygrometricum TaxID=472368 RepID=A0A2Z7A320_9LAMI|nr:hypothetical protein F511_38077 [Dorcoceras hygrometricum]